MVVSDDPDPEMATNEEWRGIMVRARKDQNFTQAELGIRVGTSQNIISLIEAGEVTSSRFVLPICRVLKIPAPVHFESEAAKSWVQLGSLLRHKNMQQFEAMLAVVKTMVEGDGAKADAPPEDAPRSSTRK